MFTPEFMGEPLQTFKAYAMRDGDSIKFSHLGFFISDVALLKDNEVTPLSDIAFVDLTFDNTTAAQNGIIPIETAVEPGNYTGIRFSIGVPQDLNTKKPADFPSSNPLSKSSYYWTAWNSYIFSKTEGKLDPKKDGSYDLGFGLHSGSDALYRTKSVDMDISIIDGQTRTIHAVLDYERLIMGIDIESNPQNHNPNDLEVITKLSDNFLSAFTIHQ